MIEVRNLCKTYTTYQRGSGFWEVTKSLFVRRPNQVQALKDLSMSIGTGELVGFIGPNGAGKSTTLKILSGVLYPSSGEVSALGMIPWKERRRYVASIGAVFGQKSQLIWDIPPLDSFCMNQAIYGIPNAEFNQTLDQLSSLLGVKDLMRQPTRKLSLGERMKCEFIMAMLHRPRIVFLDEPTIGLDVIAKEAIRGFIRELNSQGVTFILTTHDLAEIESLARRVIVINHGRKIFDGDISRLKVLFGTRKIIRLCTKEPAACIELPGLRLLEARTANDHSYELDFSQTDLEAFIAHVGKSGNIADMSISDIPIETIVKGLYNDSPTPAAGL